MTEQTVQSGRFTSAKKDYDWAIAILGAIVSTPPVIAFIQKGFHIELHWALSNFVHYYQALFTPIIDAMQWPIRNGLKYVGVDIVIPQWIKDVHAISFVLAGIFVRGWASKIGRRRLEMRLRRESEREFSYLEGGALAEKMRWRRFNGLLVHSFKMTGLALLLGLTGLGLIAWILVPVGAFLLVLVVTFLNMNSDTRRESNWPHVRHRFKKRMKEEWATVASFGAGILDVMRTAVATAIAVAVFYLSNAILPPLGF